jgi:SAM-dependent methyltransferase
MPWEIFERAAERYDTWYETPRGRRADQAERALVDWLLGHFSGAESLLDVGCGTGHTTAWLATRDLRVFGLERAPAMLGQMRAVHERIPAILGDAHHLPVRDRAVDLTLLLTTLEFLEQPLVALLETVRVSRRGVLLVVLNRWSAGGLSRRIGPQARGSLLGQARDMSVPGLRAMARSAAGPRLESVHCASTLLPDGLWAVRTALPFGDVLGVAIVLTDPCDTAPANSRLEVSRSR